VTVREALSWAKRQLSQSGIENPILDAEVILCHVMEWDRLRLYMELGRELTQDQKSEYERLIGFRLQHMPVAYIVGKKEFYGIELTVGPGVLIPRPETELLVEKTLEAIRTLEKPRLADIGCGSGAISVALSVNNERAVIYASDISEVAEKYTRINIEKHQVGGRVFFVRGDIWQPFEELGIKDLDVVVSNPPYIPSQELADLPEDVKQEPKLALDGGFGGFEFYEKIIKKAPEFLKAGGLIAFEIGWNQVEWVKKLLTAAGFIKIEVIKDYAGFDRVVMAVLKKHPKELEQ